MAVYFRDSTTGNYITLQQAKAAHPNVSVANPLTTNDYTALGIEPVTDVPLPATSLIQQAVLGPAVQNAAGQWTTSYTVVDLATGLTPAQLVTFKQNLANTLSQGFSNTRTNLINNGFQYNFSAYTTDAGIACSTLNPNGTAGLLTIQMDAASQINWLGVTAEAQVSVATTTYGISGLTLTTPGAGYTVGTKYALTATGNGSGFSGTVDVDASGNLTNAQIVSAGQGYTGATTIDIDISAGTPTTAGVITPVIVQPTTFALRVEENYNVLIPAADIIAVLGAAAKWATTLLFTSAGLKDKVNAMVNDTTKSPDDMLAVTWPAS